MMSYDDIESAACPQYEDHVPGCDKAPGLSAMKVRAPHDSKSG
jgi:hypothetical protein